MHLKPKPLGVDTSQLTGLSEDLVRNHHISNYTESVRQLNEVWQVLSAVDFSSIPAFHLNRLKREELIATNSVLLHELYFDNLSGTTVDMPPPMAVALAANFGSVQRWKDEFTAIGRALSAGSGWVLLNFSPLHGGLVNQWASDHTQSLAGAAPVLALDMYEHAYLLDYGAHVGPYVDAFMSNINWDSVHRRYQRIVHDAAEPLSVEMTEVGDSQLIIDVRRTGVFKDAKDLITGAVWRDPSCVSEWGSEIPADRPVLVYCVAGHEMSRGTALRLKSAGIDARFLVGGIDAWKAAGGAVTLI